MINFKSKKLWTIGLVILMILTFVNVGMADGGNDSGGATPSQSANVIQNGGFELRESNEYGEFGADWELYSNGQAHFGWYDETWREAVQSGEHAQLMEIKEVHNNQKDRVMAIYQTVNVVPNSTYDLTLYAMVRSAAGVEYRNIGEYELSWGIDPAGGGDYNAVSDWNAMPLTEQSRIGSNGEYPDDKPLFYEMITGKVETKSSSRITLFIRGVKKFTNDTEFLFDVDDVSLVGSTSTATTPTSQPSTSSSNLPNSGGILAQNISLGTLVLSGLVLVLLGVGATAGILRLYS